MSTYTKYFAVFMPIFRIFFLNFASYKYTKRSELDHTLLYSNYGTFTKNNRPYGARSALFSLHPAALSLAKIEVTSRRRSVPEASNITETPFISPVRSKHYLPTARASVKCP